MQEREIEIYQSVEINGNLRNGIDDSEKIIEKKDS